jgi:hypothetical protein
MFKLALALAVVGAFAADTAAPIISLDLALASSKHPEHAKLFAKYPKMTRKGAFPTADTKQTDQKTAKHFEGVCEVNTNKGTKGYTGSRVYTTCKLPKASAYDHHDNDVSSSLKLSGKYFLFKPPHTKTSTVKDCSGGGCPAFNKANPNFNKVGMIVLDYEAKDDSGNKNAEVDYALIVKDSATPEAKKQHLSQSAKYGAYVSNNHKANSRIFTKTAEITRKDSYDGTIKGVQSSGVAPHVHTCNKPNTRTSTVQWCDTAGLFGYNNQNNCISDKRSTTVTDNVKVPITIGKTDDIFHKDAAVTPSSKGWNFECTDNIVPKMCKDNCGTNNYAVSDACNCDAGKIIKGAAVDKKFFPNTADYKTKGACRIHYTTSFGGATSTRLNKVGSAGEKFTITVHARAHAMSAKTSKLGYEFKVVDTKPPMIDIESKLGGGWNKAKIGKSTGNKPTDSYGNDGSYTAGNHWKGTQNHQYALSKNLHGAHNSIVQHSAGYVADIKQIKSLDDSTFTCADQCTETPKKTAMYKFFATGAEHNCVTDKVQGNWKQLSSLSPSDLRQSKADVTPYLVIQYACQDDADHITATCRTIFNQDHTLPIVNIVGNEVHREHASDTDSYVDDGAKCSDAVDGQINSRVEVSGDIVDLRQVGTYHITYECQDSAGNMATGPGNVRTVIVEDTICPSCDLSKLYFPQGHGKSGNDWPLTPKIDCTGDDQEGGECTIEASFKILEGGVQGAINRIQCEDDHVDALKTKKGDWTMQKPRKINVNKVGTYYLIWKVEDSNGNNNHQDRNGKDCTLCDQNNKIQHIQQGENAERCGKDANTHTKIPGLKGNWRKSQFRTIKVVDNEIPVITIRPAHKNTPATAKQNPSFHPINGKKWDVRPTRDGGKVIPGFPALMAETSSNNGWVVGALASAVAAVALLGFTAKRTTSVTEVPV